MLQRAVLALCLTLLFAFTAAAQEPSLWLAGVDMRLGMPQEPLIKRLSEGYDVIHPKGMSDGFYLIYERQRDGDDGRTSLGSISFEQGKLTHASKEWYDSGAGSDYKLADALHTVLTEMEKRGETLLSMRTRASREPTFALQEVRLSYGKREVTIANFDYKNTKSVQVTESIRIRPLLF